MSHYFIDRNAPRIMDLLHRMSNVEKALDRLEPDVRKSFRGDRFVNDEELSRLLKVSRRTLHEYRMERILPYYQMQGKVLYRESEIQEFLESIHRKSLDGEEWI